MITESDFHDRNKMEQLFQRFEAIDDVAAVTFSIDVYKRQFQKYMEDLTDMQNHVLPYLQSFCNLEEKGVKERRDCLLYTSRCV